MTSRGPASTRAGAARFAAPPPRRHWTWPASLGSAIVLLALVAGVPAALLTLAGPPRRPISWPTWDSLSASVGIDQVLAVLVVLAWILWAQFVVCVLVEVVAALRGGVLARRIPLSGPSQRLARVLVTSALLAGTLVGPVGAAQAAGAPVAAGLAGAGGPAAAAGMLPGAASAPGAEGAAAMPGHAPPGLLLPGSFVPGSLLPGPDALAAPPDAAALQAAGVEPAAGVLEAAGQAVHDRHSADFEREERALEGRKVYQVKAPAGRHHDSLWAIAERHLGDGRRYPEIYRLNEGRVQPDGRSLHLARLIQPGWRLIMPEDAVGVPRYVVDRRAAPGSSGHSPRSAAGTAPNRSERTGSSAAEQAETGAATRPAQPSQPAAQAPTAPAAATSVAPSRPAGSAQSTRAAHPTQLSHPSAAAVPPVIGTPPPPAQTQQPVGTHAPTASPALAAPQTQQTPQPKLSKPAEARNPYSTSAARPRPQPSQPAAGRAPQHLADRTALGGELVGAGLLAAALLGTLLVIRRRRGTRPAPDPEEVDSEVWLRTGADADRGALLDLALRSLTRTCRDAGRPLPQAYGAVVDGDGLDLLLTMTHPSAPPPWTPMADGLRWRLTYTDAQHLVAEGDSAYPLLASVGRDTQGRDALINLGAAAGPVAVVGSPAMAAAVVRALALGLAGNPWSRGIEVLTCDLPPALPAIAAGRLIPCAGSRDLTDRLEEGSGRMPRTGPVQILTGGPAPGSRPERVAVYGAALNAPTAARLQALTGRRADLAVLVVGELPGARWRLVVDDTGNLSCDELSLNVQANRLGDGSIERLHALFMSASTTGQRPGAVLERSDDGQPMIETDDVTWAQAPVRVAILGDPEVRTPGMIEPSRKPLAAELVAYLALHPAGAHPTVLASAIWPMGVTPDVRDATIEQVREWLGADGDGSPLLREGHDGRLRLSTDVPCDWDVLRTLLSRAGQSPDPSRERDLLVRALHLVRGPVLGGITHGTYTWLPRTDLEQQAGALIVRAADRLSAICAAEADQPAVAEAAAAGLRAVPSAQQLWRHILRAEHALGGPTRMARAVDHLRFALATSGVDVEPETQALIDHLASVPSTRT